MRKIRDVLRLSAAGLSKRQIAASLGIGPTAAGACLRRAREAGISWPLPDDLGDAALECRLYPAPAAAAKDWRSRPDWPAVHRELRRKGVTLQLVWEEYRATAACFFHSGVSRTRNLGSSPRPLSASSDARAPRIPSYIMVRLSFVNA
jgi:hypothetical protein